MSVAPNVGDQISEAEVMEKIRAAGKENMTAKELDRMAEKTVKAAARELHPDKVEGRMREAGIGIDTPEMKAAIDQANEDFKNATSDRAMHGARNAFRSAYRNMDSGPEVKTSTNAKAKADRATNPNSSSANRAASSDPSSSGAAEAKNDRWDDFTDAGFAKRDVEPDSDSFAQGRAEERQAAYERKSAAKAEREAEHRRGMQDEEREFDDWEGFDDGPTWYSGPDGWTSEGPDSFSGIFSEMVNRFNTGAGETARAQAEVRFAKTFMYNDISRANLRMLAGLEYQTHVEGAFPIHRGLINMRNTAAELGNEDVVEALNKAIGRIEIDDVLRQIELEHRNAGRDSDAVRVHIAREESSLDIESTLKALSEDLGGIKGSDLLSKAFAQSVEGYSDQWKATQAKLNALNGELNLSINTETAIGKREGRAASNPETAAAGKGGAGISS